MRLVSPVLVSGHALLVNRPRQLLRVWEDVVVVQDDRLDDLVHVGLTRHLVERLWRGQEGGAEHDGQVPSIHHVLVAVLREAGERERPHNSFTQQQMSAVRTRPRRVMASLAELKLFLEAVDGNKSPRRRDEDPLNDSYLDLTELFIVYTESVIMPAESFKQNLFQQEETLCRTRLRQQKRRS